ncbi:Tbf1p SCDLUD_002103 [Saccharomycodes ludwigii]|uniref:Tbf1p n=1 Tax=Saccharomycodes ludwigii TaxID=36035 RepID=UPI001E896472|nr:hypothetical protein SCDLUD_002103 [Saccharomycodes ludwigii]KAH3902285.1 hypothetical protein SCDLUD_002103 [Saccharomycodes ludwigii]
MTGKMEIDPSIDSSSDIATTATTNTNITAEDTSSLVPKKTTTGTTQNDGINGDLNSGKGVDNKMANIVTDGEDRQTSSDTEIIPIQESLTKTVSTIVNSDTEANNTPIENTEPINNEYSSATKEYSGFFEKLPLKTHLTFNSYVLLNNLSSQILGVFLNNNPETVLDLLFSDVNDQTNVNHTNVKTFDILLNIFQSVLKIYGKPDHESPFITLEDIIPGIWDTDVDKKTLFLNSQTFIRFAKQLSITDKSNGTTQKNNSALITLELKKKLLVALHKTNMTIYILSFLGFYPYGFKLINRYFLDVLNGSSVLKTSFYTIDGNKKQNQSGGNNKNNDRNDDDYKDEEECDNNNTLLSNSITNGEENVASLGNLGTKLLKSQGVIFLDLKTQAYISSIEHELSMLSNADATKTPNEETNISSEIISKELRLRQLNEIFNLDEIKKDLLSRKNGKYANLSPGEREFMTKCGNRKDHLISFDTFKSLSSEYEWTDFSRGMLKFITKELKYILLVDIEGNCSNTSNENDNRSNENGSENTNINNLTDIKNIGGINNSILLPTSELDNITQTTNNDSNTNGYLGVLNPNTSKRAITAVVEDNDQDEQNQEQSASKRKRGRKRKEPSNNYELIPKTKQKRLWTSEEEDALLAALKVCGPSWSKILDLYGAGGKISEQLKNRSQVQLKDKARNWKMFFLKTSLPVPSYLKTVTGGLERTERQKQKNKKQSNVKKTDAFTNKTPKRIQKTTIRMDLTKFEINEKDWENAQRLHKLGVIPFLIKEPEKKVESNLNTDEKDRADSDGDNTKMNYEVQEKELNKLCVSVEKKNNLDSCFEVDI